MLEVNVPWPLGRCNFSGPTSQQFLIKDENVVIFYLFSDQLLSNQGVPMIYMGDEYGHTKGGNNNTYCHDNYVILYAFLISSLLL